MTDPSHQDPASFTSEKQRIVDEMARRRREVNAELYAPWNAAQQLALAERRLHAARMLRDAGVFPQAGDRCLEIGYGTLGWLGELLGWGLRTADLHGIELDSERALVARRALPDADLRQGDAAQMPWRDGTFKLVIASTVFTSVLDDPLRRALAGEIDRVLAPGGAFLFYDFRFDNPRNPNVRKVSRRELRRLFPRLSGTIRSLTLAPPIARRVAPISWSLAVALAALPFLRSHLLAVLVKPAQSRECAL